MKLMINYKLYMVLNKTEDKFNMVFVLKNFFLMKVISSVNGHMTNS